MSVSLLQADAGRLPLPDQSVALVVTSPPYWALRSYRDGDEHYDGQLGSEATPGAYLAALWAVLDECWRVLRPDGSCWINLGDKFSGAGPGGSTASTSIFTGKQRTAQDDAPRVRDTSGYRSKSRLLLPHRFALGAVDPLYRATVEQAAGVTPVLDPPQWICRMDLVWAKPNGLPESVTDRVRASHEYWFHLTKSARYYSALDAIREDYSPQTEAFVAMKEKWTEDRRFYVTHADETNSRGNGGLYRQSMNPLGKLPGSVWEVATEPLLLPDHLPQHFAAFPSEWPRRLVLGWSPSGVCVRCGEGRRPVCEKTLEHVNFTTHASLAAGREVGVAQRSARVVAREHATITGTACACPTPDAPTRPATVLDPFGGTGTTAIVAAALGRHGVSVDLSADYHRIARWRDQDGGLRAKALGVDRPERQIAGQLSLLEAVS